MIIVTRERNCITVKGHAGYAEYGKDIVCAAVSALTYNLQESINKLTEDTVGFSYASGEVIISFGDISANTKLLIDSFIIGIEMIALSYPDNVELTRRECH